MDVVDRISKFFKSRKNYRIYVSAIIIYLLVILIFKIKTVNELKDKGIFTYAKILEINPGSYAGRHIKYEFMNEGKLMYGYHSFQAWEEAPVIGKYYLNIYLKDKNHLNYLFMDIKLPDTVDLSDDPTEFIPEDVFIKFWRL